MIRRFEPTPPESATRRGMKAGRPDPPSFSGVRIGPCRQPNVGGCSGWRQGRSYEPPNALRAWGPIPPPSANFSITLLFLSARLHNLMPGDGDAGDCRQSADLRGPRILRE